MDLFLSFDDSSPIPLYTQAVEGLKSLIITGKITPGTKLPSSRELSESLGISRCTASKAYEELARQGLINTKAACGTYVSPTQVFDCSPQKPTPSLDDLPDRKRQLSQFGRRILHANKLEADAELHPELNFSAAALTELPIAKWREMLSKSSRNWGQGIYKPNPFGHLGLRKAIAAYLQRSRGMSCTEEQIVIFSGTQAALDLICRLFLNPGDCAVVEDPGFPGARRSFIANGARIIALPVDEQGMRTELLEESPEETKLAYVTPAHHDPLGVTMTADRRKRLLNWAANRNAIIIEDAFDCEYRYSEKPIPSLQSADNTDTVIYLSSFWTVLFPIVNLGFMVLPQSLIPILHRCKSLVERDFQFVEHEALAHFISEGHLERHIRKMRILYAKRREILVKQLYCSLDKQVRIRPCSSGMHLVISLGEIVKANEILNFAEAAGLPMVSVQDCYGPTQGRQAEFLIPFAHVEEARLIEAVDQFAHLFHAAMAIR